MGVLDQVASLPLVQQFFALGLASQIAVGFISFIIVSVIVNVAQQLLFKNPNEPPVVFHWFPFIGSTVTYGMEPYKFFKENRAKVRLDFCVSLGRTAQVLKFRDCSLAMSSPSFSSGKRLRWQSAPPATSSS